MALPSTVDYCFHFMQQSVLFSQSYLEDTHQKCLSKKDLKELELSANMGMGGECFFHNYCVHRRKEIKQGSKKCEIECANHALHMSRRMKTG